MKRLLISSFFQWILGLIVGLFLGHALFYNPHLPFHYGPGDLFVSGGVTWGGIPLGADVVIHSENDCAWQAYKDTHMDKELMRISLSE